MLSWSIFTSPSSGGLPRRPTSFVFRPREVSHPPLPCIFGLVSLWILFYRRVYAETHPISPSSPVDPGQNNNNSLVPSRPELVPLRPEGWVGPDQEIGSYSPTGHHDPIPLGVGSSVLPFFVTSSPLPLSPSSPPSGVRDGRNPV